LQDSKNIKEEQKMYMKEYTVYTRKSKMFDLLRYVEKVSGQKLTYTIQIGNLNLSLYKMQLHMEKIIFEA
jgi:hypothetical protein